MPKFLLTPCCHLTVVSLYQEFNPDDHATTNFIQQLPRGTSNAVAGKTWQAFTAGTLGFVVTGQ
jgi:hypothetical protein